MNWELLPIELRVLILSFRHEIRNDACKTIQKKWNKYFGRKCAAIDITGELHVDENGTIITTWRSTAKIMKYCSRVLTGRTHEEFWNIILENLNEGLNNDKNWISKCHQTLDDRVIYYYKTKRAYDTLIERFSNFK